MRTTTKGGIVYTYPDQDLWKQERVLVQCERASGSSVTAVDLLSSPSTSDIMASYTLDSSGKVTIDITDYIRLIAVTQGAAYFAFFAAHGGSEGALAIRFYLRGLINPASVIIPANPIAGVGALVVPPSMYYAMDQDYVQAEFYAPSGTGTWGVSGSGSMASDGRSIGQVDGDYAITRNGSIVKKYRVRTFEACKTYAFVRWVSFSGATRMHWFEVVKQTTEAADVIDLETLTDGYREARGRADGMTLRVDCLDVYDYWYYADIITGHNVEVSIDGGDGTWGAVQVNTKRATIPNGDNFDGKLDVTIKWKHYDAIIV